MLQLEPLLRITDASPGSDSICGCSILDRIFEKTLREKSAGHSSFDVEVLDKATTCFENMIKRCICGIAGEEFDIPVLGLHNDPRTGVRRGKLRMIGAKIETIFKPVIQEVP